MRIGIYPGSFDPVTLGHLDIIERGARLVDRLIVGVLVNGAKSPMFTMDERVELIRRVTADMPNVTVKAYDGLLVELAQQKQANVLIRGLRAVTDFEYELQIAHANHKLNPYVDTIFLTTDVEYSYVSSSIVREVASYGGDIRPFVPECIVDDIYKKAGRKAP